MKRLPKLVSTALWMAAGASTYLFFLNRLLINIRDRRYKSFLIRSGGLLSVSLTGLLGWLAGWTRWAILPSIALALAGTGEIKRLAHRAKHRGAPPVHEDGPSLTLRRPVTTTDLLIRCYETRIPGWTGPAIRVAHVSDFHLNSHLPLSYFQDAMRRVAAAQPDLLFFTGDFVTYPQYIPLMASVLPLARGRLGTFGVIGNHDNWVDAPAVRALARSVGVQMLGNSTLCLSLDDAKSLQITGYEHPWDETRWHAPEHSTDTLALVLTHTPDNIYALKGLGIDAVFAGHYHGGQICVPGIGPLVVPSRYGRRYDRGHFVFGRTHLFVTAGLGSAEPPVRIWCPPDVLIVDFLPGGKA